MAQVTAGQALGITSKNTFKTFIQIIHPQDLILTVFGFYPYDVQEQIVLGPESAATFLGLELHADREDWNTDSKLAGSKTLTILQQATLCIHVILDCYKKEFVSQNIEGKYGPSMCKMPWSAHFFNESASFVSMTVHL